MRDIAFPAAIGGLLLFSACVDTTGPVEPGTPFDVDATVGVPPDNVLSARVSFSIESADSVRVVYETAGGTAQSTPFTLATGGMDTVVVLGLRPSTEYRYHVEARAGGGIRSSKSSTFRTGALPDDLEKVRMERLAGTGSRFALTGLQTPITSYAVAFDPTGAIVWYRDFQDGIGVADVRRQSNGNLTAYVGATTGWQATEGTYVEFTAEGDVVRTWEAPSGYYLDNHELQITGSGAATKGHFFTYDIRDTDLTSIGGPRSVKLAGHQIVRRDASGSIEFRWDGWDRFSFDEWLGDEFLKRRAQSDFDHPNSLTFDPNGNYVVSWRNLDQVTAVDPRTGAVLWRIGGLKGEYRFVNDPWNGFTKQHAAHILPNGNLLLFDNGSDREPLESRAVEYRLDHSGKTATLVWEYRHRQALYTPFTGWVERLPNGNTWVAYAFAGRAMEVTPTGEVVWEGLIRINGTEAILYRVVALESLYTPGR